MKTFVKMSSVLLFSQLAARAGFAEDFFVKATANFKDGTKLEFNCTRADGATNNSMKEMFQPVLGNKENSYTAECTNSDRTFFSVFFKFNAGEKPDGMALKPFTNVGKIPLEKQFNMFTVRAKGSDKEMYLHSFLQLPQHYEGTPSMKINSFAEVQDKGTTYHVVAASGSADFNGTQMDSKSKNAAGKITWDVKMRAKYIKSPR
jgi:hypothetical protein